MVSAALALPLAACVSDGEVQGIAIDIAPGGPVRIVGAGAEQEAAETVIRGEAVLSRTGRATMFTGSLDATVDIPGGPRLVFRDVRLVVRPRPRIFGREAFFAIHAGRHLPPGSRVHLVYRER
jgi:hypothetical protein